MCEDHLQSENLGLCSDCEHHWKVRYAMVIAPPLLLPPGIVYVAYGPIACMVALLASLAVLAVLIPLEGRIKRKFWTRGIPAATALKRR